MNEREKTKEIALLANDVESLTQTSELLEQVLGRMVGDDVDSETGELMFFWNRATSVYIQNYGMMAPPQQHPPGMEVEPEENPSVQGLSLLFSVPLKANDMSVGVVSMGNALMIRTLERLKKDLAAEKKKLQKQLSKLAASESA